jgi:PAS domain S-box-containing protein
MEYQKKTRDELIEEIILLKKQLETSAISVEGKFMDVFEYSMSGISITSTDGIRIVNKSFCDILGYTEDELIRLAWEDMTYTDDIEECRRYYNDLDKGKINFAKWEKRYIHKTGKIIWTEITAIVRRDENGKEIYLMSIINDISRRKEAENSLKRSEELFRVFMFNLPAAVFIKDDESNLVYANKFLMDLFSWNDAIGKNTSDLLPPDMAQAMIVDDKRVIENGPEIIHEKVTDIKRIDYYFETHKFPFYIGDKVFLGAISVNETTRVIAERNLAESEERFKLLLNSAGEAIYGLDINGNCTYCNETCVNQLGYKSAEDLLGKNMHNLIHYKHNDGSPFDVHDCKIFKAFQECQKTHVDDEVLWRADGSSFPAEYWSYPQILNGEIIGSVVTFLDITERLKVVEEMEQNELQLRELVATKDKFFSIIAHDLKTPFSSILGFSDLMVEKVRNKDYETVEKYSEIIQASAIRADALLTNLLEWSRAQTGRMEFNPEHVDLCEMIKDAINLTVDFAEQKNIKLITEIPSYALTFIDKTMINSVLRNLIANAIKFSFPGSDVKITLKSEKNEFKISVKDKGVGISPDNINKLFRIDESITTKGTRNETGTGLGLLLCKEFVEKNNGKISVSSDQGNGTVFLFTLPKI